jgi:phage major head subunit gpT-like protein
MLINATNLNLVYDGFKSVYTDAYLAAEVHWDKVAMAVSSEGASETYGWLGQLPQLREWIGPRHVKNLTAHGFTIENRKFESTTSIPRDSIADDKLGVFKPAFSEMGQLARTHPEELVFGLLGAGFTTTCFDGQNFFDTDHPSKDKNGAEITVSNTSTGAGPAWFLLDTSRAVKPIIWQEREKYEFTALNRPDDQNVFLNDEYLFGVRARVNAGFGLWQLAYGSTATLDDTAYAAARAAMMGYRSAEGRLLGIKPTTLVVPPALEEAALYLLNAETKDGGGSNPYAKTADLIVTPWLEA